MIKMNMAGFVKARKLVGAKGRDGNWHVDEDENVCVCVEI